MTNKKKQVLLTVLVTLLMLVSTLVIFTGASEAVAPETMRAVDDKGRVLYVYQNDKILADEWRTFLMNEGYYVDLLPVSGLSNAQYENYDFVVIGNETVNIAYSDAEDMYRSNIPILAVGIGGVYTGIRLGMFSNGYYSSYRTTLIDAKDLFIYNTPNSVSGVPGTLTLYSESAYRIYLLRMGDRSANQTLYMGYANGSSAYSPIGQINNFLFYGFTQSPKSLTATGMSVMENILYYLDPNNNYNVGIPRVSTPIILDGKYTYLFEWYSYHHIYVDESGLNYTAFYEDYDNLYIMIHIANTTNSDYFAFTFDSNNTRISGSTDEHTFYVLLSESSGVTYRESDSSGVWGTFKSPDGVNITANWTFNTNYDMAEIKISKSYLGVNMYTDNLLGFGIQYTGVINYPTTFSFRNSSTYLTMYSENHWTGQYEAVSSNPGYSPNVDGVVNYYEWYGAASYYVQDTDFNPVMLKTVYDGDAVYFGGYIANYSGVYSAIYLYFDPDNNGGTSPQTDDFRLRIDKYSDDSMVYAENYGTGSGWSGNQPVSNATLAATMNGDRLYFEMRVNYSKLGLQRGVFKDVHMRVRSYVNGTGYNVPYYSSYTSPDEWKLILTSASAWGVGFRTFDAHNGSAITLDGSISNGEWNDAFPVHQPVPYSGKDIDVYMKTDVDKEVLNIQVHYPNPGASNSTAIYIGFDVNYDHDGAVRDDDFVISVTFDNVAMEWKGTAQGTWNTSTPQGWTYSMDNSSVGEWTVEISINYSKLNILRGVPKNIGVIVLIVDSSVGSGYVPLGGTLSNTSTWNLLTSSDNWGTAVVPELNPVLAVLLIVGLLAVIVRRKK
ncbi:MAG: hypothetical protein GXO25_04185 [Euryarchaeota archaeon]|nr:hypothetical protein [Euryarchaeota archaeon]